VVGAEDVGLLGFEFFTAMDPVPDAAIGEAEAEGPKAHDFVAQVAADTDAEEVGQEEERHEPDHHQSEDEEGPGEVEFEQKTLH
jgi:hypothetical protein